MLFRRVGAGTGLRASTCAIRSVVIQSIGSFASSWHDLSARSGLSWDKSCDIFAPCSLGRPTSALSATPSISCLVPLMELGPFSRAITSSRRVSTSGLLSSS